MNKTASLSVIPLLFAAHTAYGQATVCIVGVCQEGRSSVSVGPTTVTSNGRDTYVNGRRVDPRNPQPLTNPNWRARVERPADVVSTPPYQEEQSPVTCKVSGEFIVNFFKGEKLRVAFNDITFNSVDEFQNAKRVLANKGYLDSKYISTPTCGPITVAAFESVIRQNPNIISVVKDFGTGKVDVSFNFH